MPPTLCHRLLDIDETGPCDIRLCSITTCIHDNMHTDMYGNMHTNMYDNMHTDMYGNMHTAMCNDTMDSQSLTPPRGHGSWGRRQKGYTQIQFFWSPLCALILLHTLVPF